MIPCPDSMSQECSDAPAADWWRGSQPCSCVSPGDLSVLSGSAAAPRESKCQLSCHIQAALVHRESFCIVMWKMQSLVLYQKFLEILSPFIVGIC